MALCNCTKIAGNKTVGDWKKRKNELENSSLGEDAIKKLWVCTFDEFFKKRVESRYFRPIKILRRKDGVLGAGFAIVTIQCSLIEFFAAFRTGKKYVHRGKDSEEVYSNGGLEFRYFLTNTEPFNQIFHCDDHATEFYKNVRCGLLHEAATAGGWKIHRRSQNGQAICFTEKIVFRNDLQKVYNLYLKLYKSELLSDKNLQRAFIRKFDSVCKG